jgi:hypothetical protein
MCSHWVIMKHLTENPCRIWSINILVRACGRRTRVYGKRTPSVRLLSEMLCAGSAWAYALGWFLVNDQVKLIAYRVLNRNHSGLLVKDSLEQTVV